MDFREISTPDAGLVNTLVTRAFSYPQGQEFFDDFPIWASPNVTRLGVFENSELIAHVGIRYAQMKTSGSLKEVALIGAVATHENHRGKGYSSQLMKEALKRIDEKKCTWTCLWGSEHEFYKKFGFQLEGIQFRASLNSLTYSPSPKISKEIQKGFHVKIGESFLGRTAGLLFQNSDLTWLEKQKTVRWFYTLNPFSFVAFERGLDLKHMVHETGGDPDGIHALLARITSIDPMAEIIGNAPELSALGFEGDQVFQESLCLARPLSSNQEWNLEYWISGLSAC